MANFSSITYYPTESSCSIVGTVSGLTEASFSYRVKIWVDTGSGGTLYYSNEHAGTASFTATTKCTDLSHATSYTGAWRIQYYDPATGVWADGGASGTNISFSTYGVIKIYKGAGLSTLYGTPYRNGLAGSKIEITNTGTSFAVPIGSYSNNYVLMSDVTYYSGYKNAWYTNSSGDKTYVSDDPYINMFSKDRSISVYTESTTTYYTVTTTTGDNVTAITPSTASVASGVYQTFTATVSDPTYRWNEGQDSGGYDTYYKDSYSIYSGGWEITSGTGTFSSTSGLSTTFAPSSNATIKATAAASATAQSYRNHITYNANGGEGSMSKSYSATESSSGVYKSITVSSNSFTRSNYKFVSWNTKADGSGTTYATGTRNINANVILYAQWKAVVGLFYWDAAEGNDDQGMFWNSSTNKGQPVTNLKAGNWNRFKALIKRMNDLESQTWSYTTTSTEDAITAAEFNNARTGINNLTGHGSLPSSVSRGSVIYARYFVPLNSSANLRDALNTAITYWNDN